MSSRRAAGGATGSTGGPAPSRREKRRERRATAHGGSTRRPAHRRIAFSSSVVPLVPLALIAGGLPIFVWSALGDQIALPRLAASFWLVGCALIALSWLDVWARVPWRAVATPCLLLGASLAASAVATAIGVDRTRSLLGEYQRYQGLLSLAMYAVMMVAALAATAYARSSRPLLVGVWIGGVLSAAYGLLQWLGLDWVHWSGLSPGRIGGAFAQPDLLGIELVAAAAASTGLLPGAGARTRAVILGGAALMLLVVVFTLSRGAFLGTAAAGLVLVLLNLRSLPPWKSVWYVAPVAALVAVAALLVPQGRTTIGAAWHRTSGSGNLGETAIAQRIGLWHTSLEMAADRPLLGAGPDAFPQLFAAYRTQDQPRIGTANARPESSHNILLDRLVDSGVVGLAIFLALIGICLWIGVRALPALPAAPRAEVAGMVSALAGYYVAVLFLYAEPATGWIPWLFLGAIVGLAAALSAAAAPAAAAAERHPAPRPWRSPALRLACGALGVALVAAGLALVAADFYAAHAERLARRGDLSGAVDSARAATRWNPLLPQYLLGLGFYQEAAAQSGRPDQERAALSTYHRLNTRFQPTAASLVREAQAQANVAFASLDDRDRVFALLERAVNLDPSNAEVRQGVAGFYSSVGEAERAKPHLAWLEQANVTPQPAPAP